MPTYHVAADIDYQAWPETAHAARCMRKYARDTQVGRAHLTAAAVALTAFSVEAFAQTLGPEAYGESWTRHPRPAERLPIKVKIKQIGKHFGVPVSLGSAPWRDLSLLLDARDKAAHPRSEKVQIREKVTAPDGDQALDIAGARAFARRNPMHEIDRLDAAAMSIEAGLLEIWVASGRSRYVLGGGRKGLWSVSLAT